MNPILAEPEINYMLEHGSTSSSNCLDEAESTLNDILPYEEEIKAGKPLETDSEIYVGLFHSEGPKVGTYSIKETDKEIEQSVVLDSVTPQMHAQFLSNLCDEDAGFVRSEYHRHEGKTVSWVDEYGRTEVNF
jgi:hypothetical protein